MVFKGTCHSPTLDGRPGPSSAPTSGTSSSSRRASRRPRPRRMLCCRPGPWKRLRLPGKTARSERAPRPVEPFPGRAVVGDRPRPTGPRERVRPPSLLVRRPLAARRRDRPTRVMAARTGPGSGAPNGRVRTAWSARGYAHWFNAGVPDDQISRPPAWLTESEYQSRDRRRLGQPVRAHHPSRG